MNKTDLVFYLSMAGIAWKTVGDQVHALVSGNVFAWLNIAFLIIGVAAFGLYEKINGTPVVPQGPTV